jgi:hypothetical protein
MGHEREASRDVVDVEVLHLYLTRGLVAHSALSHHRAYVRNIAYSLQYIDHLLDELGRADLRRTLHSQTCKAVVVVGMGVVEAILWYLLLTTGQAHTKKWTEIKKLETPAFDQSGHKLRIVNVVEQELNPPQLDEMTLDTMVKRAEKRALLGSLEHAVYGHLKTLRQLRNRVHIHSVQHDADTDWFSFTGREVALLLNALRSILSLTLFQPTPDHLELLSFLDTDRVERRA